MGQPTISRRERLRAETSAEIKAAALAQVATGGAAAVSLRAIARDMGMTAGAIYSYFDTRDALINTLISDVYTSLAAFLEQAHATLPEQDTARRILAQGHAYRQWAVAHPEEFRLVYGGPVPGDQPALDGPAADAALRICSLLAELVAAAWPSTPDARNGAQASWEDFEPGLTGVIAGRHPELPPAAAALTLRVWGRMHGLVALEVYGHLRMQVADPAKLYHQELLDLVASLGLEVPADAG